jgi:hypothetical protein
MCDYRSIIKIISFYVDNISQRVLKPVRKENEDGERGDEKGFNVLREVIVILESQISRCRYQSNYI